MKDNKNPNQENLDTRKGGRVRRVFREFVMPKDGPIPSKEEADRQAKQVNRIVGVFAGAVVLGASFAAIKQGVESYTRHREETRVETAQNEDSVLEVLRESSGTRMTSEAKQIPKIELPRGLGEFVASKDHDADREDSIRLVGLPEDLTKEEDKVTFFPFPVGRGWSGGFGIDKGEQPLSYELTPWMSEEDFEKLGEQDVYVGSDADLGDTKAYLVTTQNEDEKMALLLVIESTETEVSEDAHIMVGVVPHEE